MAAIRSSAKWWKCHKNVVLVISLLVIIVGSIMLSIRFDRQLFLEHTEIASKVYKTTESQKEKTEMPTVKMALLPLVRKNTQRSILLTLSTMKLPKFNESFKNPCWYERYKNKVHFRCFPYFYLAGFPKCGTTDLFIRLLSHPLIIGGLDKETHYFARGFYMAPPKNCLSEFHCGSVYFSSEYFSKASQFISLTNGATFPNVNISKTDKTYDPSLPRLEFMKAYPRESVAILKEGQKFKKYPGITVDGSPSTAWDHQYYGSIAENEGYDFPRNISADWIRRIYPGAKIIIIVRDPVKRAFSDYKLILKLRARKEKWRINVNTWKTNSSEFHEYVVKSIRQMEECLQSGKQPLLCTTYKYEARLEIGLYYYHIKSWLEKFPRRQILILRFEDYVTNVHKTLAKVYKFLDLPAISEKGLEFISKTSTMNTAWVKGVMAKETEALLTKFFKPFNEKLAQLLDDDRFLWHTQ